MSEWLIALISGGILANILVWVFLWARRSGSVNTRLDNLEKWVNDPPVRPECSEIFTEIKENLANLNGKMDTVLFVMNEKQKNDEKKHIAGKEKPKSTTVS